MPRSRNRALLTVCLAAVALALAPVGRAAASGADPASADFFEARIRPVLVEQCYSCHSEGAEKLKAGLKLDSRAAQLAGGETGPALVPGEPDKSLLLRAITYEDPDLQMPPKTRLTAAVVADFRAWISQGAAWPTPALASGTAEAAKSTGTVQRAASGFDLERRKSRHWAWKPITSSPAPEVRDAAWPRGDLDHWVLAGLEARGLKPGPDADPRTRLRRLSFALTGLPPTPAELAAFERDPSPAGWARAVDRLLDSPHFGERWARHWLDKVRYAETMGHEFDYPILGAWRYRDYVIRAFNRDVPYDRFAREQIAGDLLTPRRFDPVEGVDESRLATAQYWLLQQVHSPVDVRNQQNETVDNQIDVVTKTFLGLTVACARCHDHKFDAVSTRDYYALHGILGSSRYAIRAIDNPAPREQRAAELRAARDQWRRHLAAEALAAGPRVDAEATFPLEIEPGPRPEDRRLATTGWLPDGEAFTADPASVGQPLLRQGTNVGVVLAGWQHGASLSRRFQGATRSPTFTIDREYLHLRAAGQGGRINVVLEGFTLIRAPIYGGLRRVLRQDRPGWVTIDVAMWKGRRAYLEYTDYPQPDPAGDLPGEAMSPEAWIAVGPALLSSRAEPPTAEGSAPSPADPSDVWRRWSDDPGSLTPTEVSWVARELARRPPTFTPELDALVASLERGITAPILAGVMVDGTGVDERVFVRGNYKTPGPVVERRFLEALTSEIPGAAADAFRDGSGRLAFADAVVHPHNPLFARVMVNWVWAHLFGLGLVASVDNFGVLGEAPSHPELLDSLAADFRAHGYSTKGLIRRIVTSRTWQMDSRALDAEAEKADPENIALHRANVTRLEGEVLRDAMLAISGRLDPKLGGAPVAVHLTPFMDGRGRPGSSGPEDGDGRRTIYLEVRRNFLSPFLLAFDTPVPATTVGRRSVSNVPAQALALMNDPLVAGLARRWAERLLRETEGPTEARVDRLYAMAFARPATGDEQRAAAEFLDQQLTQQTANETAAWTDFCHALFNTKEFAFVR